MWDIDDISFKILDDMTDDPIVTLPVSTPIGLVSFVADVFEDGASLRLRGTHVQGAVPDAIGMADLTVIAQAVLQRTNYDELVVDGASRTTGARPGHRPRLMRIRRHILLPRSA